MKNFNSVVYSQLKDVNVVKHNPNYDTKKLSKFGEIIFRHNLETHIGISLIHKHFNLQSNEKMVGNIDPNNFIWTASPCNLPDTDLIPINWQVAYNKRNQEWNFFPVDFLLKDDKFLEEQRFNNVLQNKKEFLCEMLDMLLALKIYDTFGMCLLLNRLTPQVPKGKVLYEQNSLDTKTSVISIVSTSLLKDPNAVTHWFFKKIKTNGIEEFIPDRKRWCDHM